MENTLIFFLTIVESYLIGSMLFGVLLAKVIGLGDLRTQGSQNVGATNIVRVGGRYGKILGILTALLDGSKGAIAILVASFLNEYFGENDDINISIKVIAGSFAIIGHIFPIWSKFQGGKGIATFFGVTLMLNYVYGLFLCLIWLVTFIAFRISSLASICSVIAGIMMSFYFFNFINIYLFLGTCVIILWKHKKNIERLIKGTEKKLKI